MYNYIPRLNYDMMSVNSIIIVQITAEHFLTRPKFWNFVVVWQVICRGR